MYVMLLGFAEEATVSPVPAARRLKVELEMPLMLTELLPPVWSVTHWTVPEAFVESTCPATHVVLARFTFAAKVEVTLNGWAAVQVTELAAVT